MEVIYKYELEITDSQILQMHGIPRFLSVQEQNGKLVVWAIIDTNNGINGREILIVGTGNEIPNYYNLRGFSYDSPSGYTTEHIGTVVMNNGLVWHVFVK